MGDEAELTARFAYTDDDGLSCPFELPLGTLTPPPAAPLVPLHDIAVLVPTGAQSSADPSSIQVIGRNLQLQQSSTGAVLVTATVAAACSTSGAADVSDSAPIFANLEAEDYQLDFGHRCGAPVGILQGTANQQPLTEGQATWLPVRLALPAGTAMQAITLAITYDDAYVAASATRFGGGAQLPEYPAVNYGDTNAVRYNGVWQCEGTAVPTSVVLLEVQIQVQIHSTLYFRAQSCSALSTA